MMISFISTSMHNWNRFMFNYFLFFLCFMVWSYKTYGTSIPGEFKPNGASIQLSSFAWTCTRAVKAPVHVWELTVHQSSRGKWKWCLGRERPGGRQRINSRICDALWSLDLRGNREAERASRRRYFSCPTREKSVVTCTGGHLSNAEQPKSEDLTWYQKFIQDLIPKILTWMCTHAVIQERKVVWTSENTLLSVSKSSELKFL